ncbi:probable protein phosphatase 2C 55 isoform X2 [Rhododendron vialii]|nr:probable protein phosphatase 2C 55 isoform X2 [Rhododendron vialii]XP_058203617.1 probable protein phosphatase 2C 55 isoform X2 [Rhododendron vialii]
MVCGAFYISKAKESKPQGDDAHFICAEKQTVGVADGVGGWSKSGVDAGQYARGLMANCVKAIENVEKSEVDPRCVLDEAYRNTNVEGSSTACILTLKNNHVVVANVGDSGFMVIREGKEVFKSNIQQRRFNCPYQLGNKTSSDRPNVAQLYRTPVVPGDVIVMGTDGLLDNMFSEDICHIVKMITESSSEPEQAAWAIAEHAYNNSVDSLAPTPFTQAAVMAGKDRLGGKADDITVIVAYVVVK